MTLGRSCDCSICQMTQLKAQEETDSAVPRVRHVWVKMTASRILGSGQCSYWWNTNAFLITFSLGRANFERILFANNAQIWFLPNPKLVSLLPLCDCRHPKARDGGVTQKKTYHEKVHCLERYATCSTSCRLTIPWSLNIPRCSITPSPASNRLHS